ncbi:hypothetical protein CPB83DRAFT_891622 [Crepidotus variabilis]|uniref:SAM domain-containing protein n=1 Tax=Crepidotus variabilis TaxID=179855 RepID=A0A9P6JTB0_9AGAR|nr:hypothetical protein CPB83DRAFT_891622 [Crepidotus variabilis]
MPRSLPAVSKHVAEWDEGDVQQWFTSLGYPQYDRLLQGKLNSTEKLKLISPNHEIEHKIRGDALCMIDAGGLQALGVSSAGQRLSILRAIYNLKMEQNIPLDEDSYIPPSESNDVQRSPPIEELKVTVKDQGRRLVTLEEENRALATAMQTFSQEIEKLRSSLKVANEPFAPPQHTRSKSHDLARSTFTKNHLEVPERSQTPVLDPASAAALATPSSSASDMGYGSKVSLNDPTWKVLPAALKKHGNDDDPKEYVMFISYGPQGNRTKRRLELEEKPLYLFKKLKEAKKNPAFLLKKIKEVRYQYGADLSNGTASQELWTPDSGLSNILPTPPSSIRGVTPEPI